MNKTAQKQGSKASPQRQKPSERQAAAMELKLTGESYRSIALKLDYRGPSGAHKAVGAYLRKTLTAPSDELRRLELLRLDELQVVAWRFAMAGQMKGIDRVLKIMKRRAELTGIDAPQSFTLKDIEGIAQNVVKVVTAEVGDELARVRIFNALGFSDLES